MKINFKRMKYQTILPALCITVLLSGCRQADQINHQDHLLQAALWFQQSAEMKALCYQAFYWADVKLEEQIEESGDKPLAIVLDIDETVLDNSPQTARQIIDGEAFNDDMWDEWCSLAEAKSIPGALEFTQEADEMGVEVFYISNRRSHLMDVTLKNLRSLEFPNADVDHVLLKTDSSVKDGRRDKVRETHKIVLLIGDNLGDFSGIFDDRADREAHQALEKYRDKFGTEFIVLPNPMYGSWEKPLRGETAEITVRNKKGVLDYYNR